MAEVQQQPTGKSPRRPRRRKKSTRIDMTAMVDVAFLLLTFFILTSTLAKPSAMSLVMPKSNCDDCSTAVSCEKMMQIYLGENDQVYWYPKCETEAMKVTDFASVRGDITGMLAANPKLIITIKASEDSRYENLVDILDEMKITGAPRYALVDMTQEDKELLSSKGLK